MTAPRIKLSDSAAKNADDLELAALRQGQAVVQAGLSDDQIAGTLADEYAAHFPGSAPEWAVKESGLELAVAAETGEILRRARLLGKRYPFQLSAGKLTYLGSATLAYEFHLAISGADSLSKGQLARLPREFERLTGLTLATSLGHSADWYRLGWPPDDDRPTQIKAAVHQLHERTGEWHWCATPGLDEDPGPQTVKDGGIDLVVWKSFGDNRIGRLVLLGQCACGNDWPTKVRDLDAAYFYQTWLQKPMSCCGQIRFMAIPRAVTHIPSWIDASKHENLLLDRIRLTHLAELAGAAVIHPRHNLEELIKLAVPSFERAAAAAASQATAGPPPPPPSPAAAGPHSQSD